MLSIQDVKSRKLESKLEDAQHEKPLDEDSLFTLAQYDEEAAERGGYSNYSYWGSTLRVFLKNRVAVSLLIVLVVLVAFTFIQPLLPGQYPAGKINNHPQTGMQLSNQAPSLSTALGEIPEGTELIVKPYDDEWYSAGNVLASISKRTKFTCLEYGEEWSLVEYKDVQGWVETSWLKLPDEIPEGPFETLSNYKVSVHSGPVDMTNKGSDIYVRAEYLDILDADAGLAVTKAGAKMHILPASNGFWFGTNNIGQDLWARVWAGTRTSLFIGFMVALTEAVIGIFVGVVWGYVRSLDRLMTEIYNVIDNIPTTIVLILISYVLRPSVPTLILAMCLTGWLGMARFIRNQIVIIRDRDYNLASRCLGVGSFRIIMRNLLPYLVSVITLRMALAIPGAIGSEVFITYIGLGLPADTPSLGNLINAGRQLVTSPSLRYQLIFPAAVLSVITISFYIIGNAFADAADPKNHM